MASGSITGFRFSWREIFLGLEQGWLFSRIWKFGNEIKIVREGLSKGFSGVFGMNFGSKGLTADSGHG